MSDFPPDVPMPNDRPNVIPAATVVIFRRAQDGGAPELLMLRRSHAMRFAGGAAVFPGGRVDPADRALAAAFMSGEDPEIAEAKVAAIRETLEETGLMIATRQPVSVREAAEGRAMLLETGTLAPVLERFGWELEPHRLTLFAHWCPRQERAFDTRFFVFDLGTGAVDVAVDTTENTHLFWASASQALHLADTGEISVIFPTRRNLERLALFESFDAALAQIAQYPVERIEPRNGIGPDGEKWLLIPDGQGYPVLGEALSTAMRG